MGVSDMNSQQVGYNKSAESEDTARYISPMEAELKALSNTLDELSDSIDLLNCRLEPIRRPSDVYAMTTPLEEKNEDRSSILVEDIRDKREWVNRLSLQVRRMLTELEI